MVVTCSGLFGPVVELVAFAKRTLKNSPRDRQEKSKETEYTQHIPAQPGRPTKGPPRGSPREFLGAPLRRSRMILVQFRGDSEPILDPAGGRIGTHADCYDLPDLLAGSGRV